LGDERLASSDPAAARRAYDCALDLGRAGVRAKRGGAAALSGDDDTALADFAALVPNYATLPESRETNVRLRAFARALYKRGLASMAHNERTRDLETAWRLDVPPASLAPAIASHWIALANTGAISVSATDLTSLSSSQRTQIRRAVELYWRAHEVDASIDVSWVRTLAQGVSIWASNVKDRSFSRMFAEELLGSWPKHPALLYLQGRSLGDSESEQILARATEGIAQLPAPVAGEHLEIAHLAGDLASMALAADERLAYPRATDLGRIEQAVARAGTVTLRARLARAYLGHADLAGARACLEVGRHAEDAATPIKRVPLERVAIEILWAEGRSEDALGSARRVAEDAPGAASGLLLAVSLEKLGRWEEIARTFSFTPNASWNEDTRETLALRVEALCRLNRIDDARAFAVEVAAVHAEFARVAQDRMAESSRR
jgi:tetratricopeptide (TPR) repeat protein